MGENIRVKQLKPFRESTLHTDVRAMINKSAELYGDKTAYRLKIKPGTKKSDPVYKDISFKQVRDDMNAFGTGLCGMGLKGKNIAIIGENSYPWALSYITLVSGAGLGIPLDKGLPLVELRNSIDRSYCDVLIFDKKHSALAEQLIAEGSRVSTFICMEDSDVPEYTNMSDVIASGYKLIEEGNREYLDIVVDPKACALLIFTSGTTSKPKAVMLSNRNLVYNMYVLAISEDIRHDDTNIAFLPYHHTFGAIALLVMLDLGITTVYCDGLKYVQKNLVEYGVSLFVGVPLIMESIYKKIMVGIKKQGKEKTFQRGVKISNMLRKIGIDKRKTLFKDIHEQLGGKMRLVVCGASALDPEVVKGFDAIGIEVVQGYGMTETSPVIAAENKYNHEAGSIGKTFYGMLVEIDNPNEEGIGEIITKSPCVMLGYFEDQEETDKILKDGWLHTGDLARVSKKGNIFICGRSKNVIVLKNGKNVYPEEIETVVANLPYVKENIVYSETKMGESDDRDQVIVLKLVYDAEYFKTCYNTDSVEEIREIVEKDIDKINADMPSYKRISRTIIQETEMIKTTTGKVKRYEEGATGK